MKYKVGDKVKVVNDWKCDYVKKGEIYTVLEVNDYKINDYGNIRINNKNKTYFYDKNLFIKYIFTKADLKDNHIVVYKGGLKKLWGDITYKEEYKENLTHNDYESFSINEVWEFNKLVWKREEQVLDEVEKKYLSDLIRPFRDKVRYIRLINYVNTIKQFISIEIKGDSSIYFPLFKKGTMYKGMEVDKNYSLEDLGL